MEPEIVFLRNLIETPKDVKFTQIFRYQMINRPDRLPRALQELDKLITGQQKFGIKQVKEMPDGETVLRTLPKNEKYFCKSFSVRGYYQDGDWVLDTLIELGVEDTLEDQARKG